MSWIEDAQKAINYIENNMFESISVDDVVSHVHYSSNHLQKMFNIATGLSVSDYIKKREDLLCPKNLFPMLKNL
jgi:AraC family transcriptional regulator